MMKFKHAIGCYIESDETFHINSHIVSKTDYYNWFMRATIEELGYFISKKIIGDQKIIKPFEDKNDTFNTTSITLYNTNNTAIEFYWWIAVQSILDRLEEHNKAIGYIRSMNPDERRYWFKKATIECAQMGFDQVDIDDTLIPDFVNNDYEIDISDRMIIGLFPTGSKTCLEIIETYESIT